MGDTINLPVTGRSRPVKINELAKRSGTASKTIRYYEEVGLLPEPVRAANGYRDYGDADVERLTFIRRCRELQIPINELKKLVNAQVDPGASCGEVDQIIKDQLEKVRNMEQELALLEKTLSELALSCQNNEVRDCEILHRLKGDSQ